jgi:pimeloyl-ACP methyl ester carboxylesterase
MQDYQHQFYQVNRLWLHTVTAGPEDGRLVIFLHGFPEFWYAWRNQICAFARAGYRVLAPDQRGYNLSDRPAGIAPYRIEELAQDVIELIAASGRERAILVGHDWGGAVAWWLAEKAPEKVERLVAINAPHRLAMQENLEHNPLQMARSSYGGFFQIPRLPEALYRMWGGFWPALALKLTSRRCAFSGEDLRLYRQAWLQPGAMTAMLNWYRALLRYRPPLPANPYISVPTLLLWGCQDRFLGSELAEMSVTYCIQARLVLFEHATHWLAHEEPHKVNQLIQAFIE